MNDAVILLGGLLVAGCAGLIVWWLTGVLVRWLYRRSKDTKMTFVIQKGHKSSKWTVT